MNIIINKADRYEDLLTQFTSSLAEAAKSTRTVYEAGRVIAVEVDLIDLRALKFRLDRVMEHLDS